MDTTLLTPKAPETQGALLSPDVSPAMAALTKELDKIVAEATLTSETVAPSLLSHVQSCFRDAENAKNSCGIIEGLSINAMHHESGSAQQRSYRQDEGEAGRAEVAGFL